MSVTVSGMLSSLSLYLTEGWPAKCEKPFLPAWFLCDDGPHGQSCIEFGKHHRVMAEILTLAAVIAWCGSWDASGRYICHPVVGVVYNAFPSWAESWIWFQWEIFVPWIVPQGWMIRRYHVKMDGNAGRGLTFVCPLPKR